MNGPAPAPVQWATANGLTPRRVTENWTGGRSSHLILECAAAAPGGTIAWAFGRSMNSEGMVSNLTLRNG
jgi:hypothetical protein